MGKGFLKVLIIFLKNIFKHWRFLYYFKCVYTYYFSSLYFEKNQMNKFRYSKHAIPGTSVCMVGFFLFIILKNLYNGFIV